MPFERYKLASFALLGALYLLLLVPVVTPLLEPVPYTDVEKQKVVWGEDGVTIRYDFVKNEGCHLVTFHVEGSFAGIYSPMGYTDLDGIERNYDRPPGSQSLNIRVSTEEQYPEVIRLHTRHDCGGTMVNRVFTEVDNPRGVK